MNIQTIKNVSDCVPLFLPHSLYLKPNARINISVSLPPTVPGKTISNWDIMEKLRQIILPDVFSVLKVVKSTLEFIRFEAEIDDREKLRNVLARIDGRSIKLSSFAEAAKVRATETKEDFPTRHDWDVFFRDTRDMDEMKPGERPDTIHFSNLPIRWFCPRHLENTENVKPSENIFKRIFEKFGEVRYVDIPICDPYRSQMKSHMSGIKTFNFDDELCFEGYVQFSEYISFVRAMDSFRGMKLIRKDGDKNSAVNIQVTFDRSKHLSDMSIKRRAIIRERLITKDKEKEEEEKVKLQREEEQQAVERRKQETIKQAELDKQHAREERRKEKQLRKLREKEEHEMNSKIRCEEKKLLIAQRKLESIRLLEALFERMRTKSQPDLSTVKNESKRNSKKAEKKKSKDKSLGKFDLRNKLVKKFKNVQEQELEKQKEKLQKTRDGKSILTKVLHDRSPSINSISSNDSILSDKNVKKKKKKKKKKRGSDSSSSSSSSSESEPEKKAVAKLGAGMMMQPQGFPMQPMFNPETGEWVFGGMGMYPYPQFFPPAAMAGGFFPNPMMYRGYRGGARGRFPRGRGRGVYSRGGNNSYENDSYQRYSKRDNEDYSNQHDNRRSKSRSPSHSYSKSRYRRSHSHRRSQSYSRSRSRSRSKKLVSTLRRTRSKSSSGWSTPTRRRKSRSWSSRSRSRSRTPRKSRSRERNDSKSSKHHSAVRLETEEIVKEAKRIQQSVERKLKKRDPASDKVNKSPKEKTKRDKTPPEESHTPPKIRKERSGSPKRSASVDSSRFVSPKRKSKNTSPGKVWE